MVSCILNNSYYLCYIFRVRGVDFECFIRCGSDNYFISSIRVLVLFIWFLFYGIGIIFILFWRIFNLIMEVKIVVILF